jgi:chromosome segregation ATPase
MSESRERMMSKYSELACDLERYRYEGDPDDELGRLVATLKGAAAALRELEAENERLERLLGGVRNDMAAASKLVDSLQDERDKLRDQVTEIPTLCRRYEAERDRLRDALERIAGEKAPFGVLSKEWCADVARAALEGK